LIVILLTVEQQLKILSILKNRLNRW